VDPEVTNAVRDQWTALFLAERRDQLSGDRALFGSNRICGVDRLTNAPRS
jgi:hypothetical protein